MSGFLHHWLDDDSTPSSHVKIGDSRAPLRQLPVPMGLYHSALTEDLGSGETALLPTEVTFLGATQEWTIGAVTAARLPRR